MRGFISATASASTFLAQFERKGGGRLAEWSVIGTAIGAGWTAIEAWSITLAKACASATGRSGVAIERDAYVN
ncbi:hypothetical protein [Bradyrhizobium sp. 23]|uniref:hypothetical protein n=1 Tax=Bradyrhizobium sp. 23 TaxID=2782667 RepID=UPI001FF73C9A|nr:hypothetical protein [Bradyrhizobium sp. 23]MCK1317637.1 hypothetical protein [Bradyrhizobium sp. 23]